MTKQSRILPEYDLDFEVVNRIPWFREELLAWFDSQGRSFPWREQGRTAYEVLVAEILLQRTTAAKVAWAYNAFLDRYPSWNALVQVSSENLQEYLKPLGLWLQKAQVFQSLATAVEERADSLPSSRSELEQLPGIGQYIASAVLLTLYNQPEPLVDVNMSRVLERFFGSRKLADIRYDPYLQTLSRRIVNSERSLQVNWAILDLGALVCKNGTPLCLQCPLRAKCKFYKQRTLRQVELPIARVAEATTVYVVASSEDVCTSRTSGSTEIVSSPYSDLELSMDDTPMVDAPSTPE
ncbi:MAG: A/G-specific adenine glycosylase [Chloroflexi bacterium]|nr:MAG: A/G-specific adenine glycosylase [Chloroflexota bacterium]